MVTGHRRHAADDPAIRLNLSAARGLGCGVSHRGAEHQPSRRPAKIVSPRDGLLPAIAPLVQMNRRGQPVDLLKDRVVVSLKTRTRTPRGHT